MSDSRTKRRAGLRAFRPVLDGTLEDRVLLSQTVHQYLSENLKLLSHPKVGLAYRANNPRFLQNAPNFQRGFRMIPAAVVQTARGGQSADVIAPDGSYFRLQLGYIGNTIATAAGDGAGGTYTQTSTSTASNLQPSEYPQPQGVLRVYAMPNGQVGIIVDGSTSNTELTINPLPHPIRKNYAHSFAYGQAGVTHILNVGQITVSSGAIGAVEGFHTTNLVGPLVIGGTQTVDRIAFNSIGPGGSIQVGGTLNTLDILQGITLNTGTRITIGQDLNLLNVGQSITLTNGSQILVGRDIAATLQPPKGTGTGSNVLTLNQAIVGTTTNIVYPSVGAYIQGNLNIGAGSVFAIGRGVDQPIVVLGSINGSSRIVVPRYIGPTGTFPNGQPIAALTVLGSNNL